jgi:RNA polymerase sigma-70 factor (ECF subfamily)
MHERPQPDDPETRFEREFRPLFTLAFRIARRILGEPTAAEDVAAEAMSRAYAHWRALYDAPYREAWVVKVATNLALTAVRRHAPAVAALKGDDHDDATATRLALVAALEALPRRQRDVIVLRHLVDLSEQQVAEQLGLSIGSVKTHLRRAKKRLRVELDPDDLGFSPA